MDNELQTNIQKDQTVPISRKIASNRSRLNEFRKLALKAKEDYSLKKNQEELIQSGAISVSSDDIYNQHTLLSTSQQRMKLLSDDQIALKSSAKLQQGIRTALEMENVSIGIMKDLEKQTNQIKDINSNINELNTEISSSNNIITRIMNRENRNRTLIGFFSVTLVTLFVLILYTKY